MILETRTQTQFLSKLISDLESSPFFRPAQEVEPLFGEYRESHCLPLAEDPKIHKEYDSLIFGVFHAAFKEYIKALKFKEAESFTFSDEGYLYFRYNKGSQCKLHTDSPPAFKNRLLTAILYCSKNNSTIVFPAQSKTIKPKQGSVLVFPAHMSYPHYTEDQDSHRRLVVTFFSYA